MREIVVKIIIFIAVFILLVVEVLRIDIQILEIVIKIVVLLLLLMIIEIERRQLKPGLCDVFIYKNRESGDLLFCTNDQGDQTRDFVKVGEGRVPCSRAVQCFLEK